jgi:hypothetical protein
MNIIYRGGGFDNIINYNTPLSSSFYFQYNPIYTPQITLETIPPNANAIPPNTVPSHVSSEIISNHKILIDSENIDVECSICLETYKKSNFVMLDCKHMFGRKCFFSWMKNNKNNKNNNNKTCPLCRNPCTKVDCYC